MDEVGAGQAVGCDQFADRAARALCDAEERIAGLNNVDRPLGAHRAVAGKGHIDQVFGHHAAVGWRSGKGVDAARRAIGDQQVHDQRPVARSICRGYGLADGLTEAVAHTHDDIVLEDVDRLARDDQAAGCLRGGAIGRCKDGNGWRSGRFDDRALEVDIHHILGHNSAIHRRRRIGADCAGCVECADLQRDRPVAVGVGGGRLLRQRRAAPGRDTHDDVVLEDIAGYPRDRHAIFRPHNRALGRREDTHQRRLWCRRGHGSRCGFRCCGGFWRRSGQRRGCRFGRHGRGGQGRCAKLHRHRRLGQDRPVSRRGCEGIDAAFRARFDQAKRQYDSPGTRTPRPASTLVGCSERITPLLLRRAPQGCFLADRCRCPVRRPPHC